MSEKVVLNSLESGYLDFFPMAWQQLLADEAFCTQLSSTWQAVQAEREQGERIYPVNEQLFAALKAVAPEQVRVVILGQDPYHQPGQAHGYAFSVPYGIKPPPSLKNMYKALSNDVVGFEPPDHGCLEAWAKQGILLLNTVLTVRDSEAASHQGLGWQYITRAILENVVNGPPVVFILWGKHAEKAMAGIDTSKHAVLTGVHPSPLSAYRGFFTQQHFKQTNELLTSWGRKPINWTLTS